MCPSQVQIQRSNVVGQCIAWNLTAGAMMYGFPAVILDSRV